MTSVQLATTSTALWVVATVVLFVLLAGWSNGTSWGLTATLVRGVRGWAERDGRAGWPAPPSAESLRPILDPYAFVRRSRSAPEGAASGAAATGVAGARAGAVAGAGAHAEVVDLGERRLPHR